MKIERGRFAFKQPLGAVNVVGGGGMLEGFEVKIVGFKPLAGPLMKAVDVER